MIVILLSGGSGKRLWPLSNEVRSKQFLKIFKRDDGTHESMVQRMYRMIREVDDNSVITIATSNKQVASIKAQLGDKVWISIEPCRRDTFPSVVLAAAYLHSVKHVNENETIVVCPVDSYVEAPYFEMLQRLYQEVGLSFRRSLTGRHLKNLRCTFVLYHSKRLPNSYYLQHQHHTL